MKRLIAALTITTIVSLGLIRNANAYIVTIDPDDYAEGTNMQELGLGVRLTSTSGAPIIATEACPATECGRPAPTGSKIFGVDPESPSTQLFYIGAIRETQNVDPFDPAFMIYPDSLRALVVQFDTATNFVSLMGTGNSTFVWGYAYDSDYNRITDGIGHTVTSGYNEQVPTRPTVSEFSLTSLTANISMVVFGGNETNAVVDHLQFNRLAPPTNVPEPSTLALLLLGMVGTILARRRRTYGGEGQ